MNFTPKQMAALNHYAHNIHLRNCRTLPSDTTVSGIENASGHLLATITSVDSVKGIFSTHAVVSFGPRGGKTFERIRRDVY